MTDLTSVAINPIGYLIIASGLVGIGYSLWNYYKISKKELEDNQTENVASSIGDGIKTFFNSRYIFLAVFVAVVGVLLYIYGSFESGLNGLISISFLIGAISTALSSFFSKKFVADTVESVVKNTQSSYSKGFKTNFKLSTSVGLMNVSAIVLGLFINLLVLSLVFGTESLSDDVFKIFIGFVAGVSTVSIFTRLSDSLFSKGAELAANEIVDHKPGITEKSVYSPASTNNDVGRIVSNIGGITADVFETFSIAIVSAILLGAGIVANDSSKSEMLIYLPLIIASIGILSSFASSYLLKSSEAATSQTAINLSEAISAVILAVSTFFAVKFLLPQEWVAERFTANEIITTKYFNLGIFWSALIGIAASVGIGYISRSFTNINTQAVKEIAGQSIKSNSNNILSGSKVALISIGAPILLILSVGLSTYYLANYYGIAIAAVSFLSNVALHQSYSTFATVSETTNSIALKSELGEKITSNTKAFNKIGNNTAGKFRIFLLVAASLAVLSMFSTFVQLAAAYNVNILKPMIMSAAILGALAPMLISSNTIGAIKRIRRKIVNETNRQFNENPSLKEANEILEKYSGDITYATEGEREIVYRAKDTIDNKTCIKLSSKLSFWETFIPAGIALVLPLLFAIFGGVEILTAMLIGLGASTIIFASYLISKGNLMGSAKNAVEEGFVYNGELIRKETQAYNASIIGERAGKPMRDAVAPAVIVIMKIIVVAALVLIPLLKSKIAKSNAIEIDRLSKIEYRMNDDVSKKV